MKKLLGFALGAALGLTTITYAQISGGGIPGLGSSVNAQVLFNSSGNVAGDSTITIKGTPKALVVTNTGSAFGDLATANSLLGVGLTVLESSANSAYSNGHATFYVGTNADYQYGVTGAWNKILRTVGRNDFVSDVGTYTNLVASGATVDGYSATADQYAVQTNSDFITTSSLFISGAEAIIDARGTYTTDSKIVGFYTYGLSAWNSTLGIAAGFWANTPAAFGGGSITTYYGFFQDAIANNATNAYSFWHDEDGVFRIKADNTFDSVYQAIPALYNPQFTKYTPGAANYERIVEQWNGNIAELGTEKGGTGTLRNLRLLGGNTKAPSGQHCTVTVDDTGLLGTTSCA